MKILPVGEHVLIKPLNDEVTYKGIVLPDTAKAKANNGIVVARGPWATQVEVGDWVVYSRKQVAQDFESDAGEALVLIKERGIIVVIQEVPDIELEDPCLRCGLRHPFERCADEILEGEDGSRR